MHEQLLTPEQIDAELALLSDAVDAFASSMKTALEAMVRNENRTGWNDPANAQDYYTKLLSHAAGVRMAAFQEVDIANFAMFLWHQRVTASRNGGQS